jgi:hypothetical protein
MIWSFRADIHPVCSGECIAAYRKSEKAKKEKGVAVVATTF